MGYIILGLIIAALIVVFSRVIKAYRGIHPKEPETGFSLTHEELAAAHEFLRKHPAIDTHAHPGRTFVRGAKSLKGLLRVIKMLGTFEKKIIAEMGEGKLACSVFNGVSDFQLLKLADSTLFAARGFKEGEEWDIYNRQMGNMRALEAQGLIIFARTADDILTAHAKGEPCGMLAMEGGDFIGDDITRLHIAYDHGMRVMTLAHYHNNEIGDIMTGEEGARGLTEFGHTVVKEMNKLGIMIDLTHASEKMTMKVAEVTQKPVVMTHAHINTPEFQCDRYNSPSVVEAVVQTGGFIGAWPTGQGISTLDEFLDRIEILVDRFGEDHVALGTDMDVNYRPVLTTYRKIPLLVGGLLARGHSEERVAKIMGGNFLRVLRAVQDV